jgi:hypothetical protein
MTFIYPMLATQRDIRGSSFCHFLTATSKWMLKNPLSNRATVQVTAAQALLTKIEPCAKIIRTVREMLTSPTATAICTVARFKNRKSEAGRQGPSKLWQPMTTSALPATTRLTSSMAIQTCRNSCADAARTLAIARG